MMGTYWGSNMSGEAGVHIQIKKWMGLWGQYSYLVKVSFRCPRGVNSAPTLMRSVLNCIQVRLAS